jgi:LmbE family N-acetylglucosaminyl deacetylase
MKNRILIVAAHGDDEILGCGGTVARLINEGAEAMTLILGEGVTSRDDKRDVKSRASECNQLKLQSITANKVLGINQVSSHSLPDNRFDSVDMLDIVKIVEHAKDEFKPDIIFTHFRNDLNIDHQITNQAVLTGTRPMIGETVKEIYAFEVLSSTEWNYPLSFHPDYFVNITETLNTKQLAMEVYKDELKEWPHPRSLKGIELNARYWGMCNGMGYAEVFQTLRRLQ